MSRTFLSVGSNVPAGFELEPEPLSAPLDVELVVLEQSNQVSNESNYVFEHTVSALGYSLTWYGVHCLPNYLVLDRTWIEEIEPDSPPNVSGPWPASTGR